jgi:hypothetical protein
VRTDHLRSRLASCCESFSIKIIWSPARQALPTGIHDTECRNEILSSFYHCVDVNRLFAGIAVSGLMFVGLFAAGGVITGLLLRLMSAPRKPLH